MKHCMVAAIIAIGLKAVVRMQWTDWMKYCNVDAINTASYEGSRNIEVLLNEVMYHGCCNHCQFKGSTDTKEGLNEVL